MNSYFGVRWDVPFLDGATQVPTPVGDQCLLCEETITEGESGLILATLLAEDAVALLPQHMECFLRSVMGSVAHLEEKCTCYGGTMADMDDRSYRIQARETVEWLLLNKAISRPVE